MDFPIDRDNLFLDSDGRIILEETVGELWLDEIKPQLNRVLRILPLLKNSLLWQVPRIRRLIQLFESRIGPKRVRIGPCKFVDFLCELQMIPGIDRDIRFLIWIFQSPEHSRRVLKYRYNI